MVWRSQHLRTECVSRISDAHESVLVASVERVEIQSLPHTHTFIRLCCLFYYAKVTRPGDPIAGRPKGHSTGTHTPAWSHMQPVPASEVSDINVVNGGQESAKGRPVLSVDSINLHIWTSMDRMYVRSHARTHASANEHEPPECKEKFCTTYMVARTEAKARKICGMACGLGSRHLATPRCWGGGVVSVEARGGVSHFNAACGFGAYLCPHICSTLRWRQACVRVFRR